MSADEDRRRRPARHQRVGVLEGALSPAPEPPAAAAGGRRHRLRSSIEPLPTASGALYLLRAGAADLVVHDPDDVDRSLLALLAGGAHTDEELAAALGVDRATVRAKLGALSAVDALVSCEPSPPLDPMDAERYARQLPYLADNGDAAALQRKLRATHIVVLGCGGLGTWTVAALASTGVGRFTLVDDDAVELSNLNRQIVYALADLGTPKVDAAAAWLRSFDDRIEVTACHERIDGPELLSRRVAGADAVVVAADTPPYVLGRWVNAACIAQRVPFITAGQLPPLVKLGPLYVPGTTACFACHEQALRAENPSYDEYVEHVQATSHRGATLGPLSGMVGTMLATELLHHLLRCAPATSGTALTIDVRSFEVRRDAIARDPACGACHHL